MDRLRYRIKHALGTIYESSKRKRIPRQVTKSQKKKKKKRILTNFHLSESLITSSLSPFIGTTSCLYQEELLHVDL